ncbi:uncharacterized protein [Aristolochia californica]|uniref:uncharacterized protein n=1 Tax=Aristolochia californica TaxID=171875 RepID=UPI0035DB7C4A
MAATCHAQEEDLFSKNLKKRYNGLLTVRMKAIKGKGAWYWSHLEPILFQNQETGSAKAIRLRCALCSALFSASNPSRTATEHLKRRTCPNLNRGAYSTFYSSNEALPRFGEHRQLALPVAPLAMIPAPCSIEQVAQSSTEPLPISMSKPLQTEEQINGALDLLADWFYDSCLSFSSLHHPKFKAFLQQIGLPQLSKACLASEKLNSKYLDTKLVFENKLRDAMFFQLSIEGWKKEVSVTYQGATNTYLNVVSNLPNGSSLFHKVLVIESRKPPADYVRELLWSVITEISGECVLRCVGIISDIGNCNSQVLRELESQNHWMVNLTCQSNAFFKLQKDFFRNLPLFTSTTTLCHKITQYFKWFPSTNLSSCRPEIALSILESVAQSSNQLRETLPDGIRGDPTSKEIYKIIHDSKFWEDLNAVISLTKFIKRTTQEIKEERPCLGQCLPLWEGAKNRIKCWCRNFPAEEKSVMEVVDRRFSKNYNQSWSASFVLDPMNLVEDSSGRYLPPFKFLTLEQEKDVVKTITRMIPKEEAPIALMELMRWRMEGLDPVYAKAVQAKERDSVTGKLRVINPSGSRLVWEIYLTDFAVLKKVATRLIFLQATTTGFAWNRSIFNEVCSRSRSQSNIDKTQKLVFVGSNQKLGIRKFTDEEGDVLELFDSDDDSIHSQY